MDSIFGDWLLLCENLRENSMLARFSILQNSYWRVFHLIKVPKDGLNWQISPSWRD
jgi:hypothetical protein